MIINRKEALSNFLKQKKDELEKRDLEILKTRDKKFIPVKIQRRFLTTEFGQLMFRRRIYKFYSNEAKKYIYISLLDEEIGIKKWAKLDNSLIEQIKKEVGSGKRYSDIVDMFPESQISLMVIARTFKSMNVNKLTVNKVKIKVNSNELIYLNVDDTWVRSRSKNKTQKNKIRIITFNLGFNKNSKRKALKNKRYFVIFNIKNQTEKLAKEVVKWGKKFFDGFEKAKLVIGGDGASWIKALAYWLNASYVLDKYHALRYLKEAFNINYHRPKYNLHNYSLYKMCVDYFENGLHFELMQMLYKFSTKKTITYFMSNKVGVENFGQSWNIGVSAESDVSKLVKSALGYGSKIYSTKVLKNIIFTRANNFNNC